jgi:hypothetical protein
MFLLVLFSDINNLTNFILKMLQIITAIHVPTELLSSGSRLTMTICFTFCL